MIQVSHCRWWCGNSSNDRAFEKGQLCCWYDSAKLKESINDIAFLDIAMPVMNEFNPTEVFVWVGGFLPPKSYRQSICVLTAVYVNHFECSISGTPQYTKYSSGRRWNETTKGNTWLNQKKSGCPWKGTSKFKEHASKLAAHWQACLDAPWCT